MLGVELAGQLGSHGSLSLVASLDWRTPTGRTMDNIPPRPDPSPLDYQSPQGVAGSGSRRLFKMGAAAGVCVSAVAYLGFWNATFKTGTVLPFVIVVSLKILAFVVLQFVKRWRSFGVGVLVSMPLVALIFFGICTIMLVVR